MTIRLLILLVVSLTSGVAWSQSSLPADGSFSAKGHLQYRSDSSGRLTLAQVWADSSHFQSVPGDIPQFGMGQPPAWFRCYVANRSDRADLLIAQIDYAHLQSVRFFMVSEQGHLLRQSAPLGWATPVANRPWQHHNPLFAFTLAPRQAAWLFVRADGGHTRLAFPLQVYHPAAFLRADRFKRSFYDYITGFLSFATFFSLLLYGLLRDRVYLFYTLYVLSGFLYLTATEGYWFVWIDSPTYGFMPAVDLAELSLYLLTLASFGFARWYIFEPVFHLNWLRRVFWLSVGALLVNSVLLFSLLGGPFYLAHKAAFHLLMSSMYLVSVLLMAGAGLWLGLLAARSAATGPARLYMMAISPAVVQVILGYLRNNNLIDDHFFIREGVALTALLEFAILSVGLGFRYKFIADERQQLTVEAVKQKQQLLVSQLKAQQDELRATQALLYAQQEKERISRDLHDHVGAQLSVIAASANTPTSEQASRMGDYAREAMQSLRDTVWAIDQPAITLAGFRSKLQQYLNRQQQQHPACTYTLTMTTPANPELTSAQALNLFRQVQEAVHNAFKHAHATAITVVCTLLASELHLSVTDNGRGFNPGKLADGSAHYGLRNLQRRADEMGGTCCIESEPGRGTTVLVTIPLAD